MPHLSAQLVSVLRGSSADGVEEGFVRVYSPEALSPNRHCRVTRSALELFACDPAFLALLFRRFGSGSMPGSSTQAARK